MTSTAAETTIPTPPPPPRGKPQRTSVKEAPAPKAPSPRKPAPAGAVPAPKVAPASGTFGGRTALPGMRACYWMKDGAGRLVAQPALLHSFRPGLPREDGTTDAATWSVVLFHPTGSRTQANVPFAEVPADCSWTWPADDEMLELQKLVAVLTNRVLELEAKVFAPAGATADVK